MAEIQEQTQLANEVSEAISSSTYVGAEIDDVRNIFFVLCVIVTKFNHMPRVMLTAHRMS